MSTASHEDWVALGLYIRARRIDLDVRQADIAKQVGVSTKTIKKLEAGQQTRYEVGTLTKVEQALLLPRWTLRAVLRGENPVIPPLAPQGLSDAEAIELARRLADQPCPSDPPAEPGRTA